MPSICRAARGDPSCPIARRDAPEARGLDGSTPPGKWPACTEGDPSPAATLLLSRMDDQSLLLRANVCTRRNRTDALQGGCRVFDPKQTLKRTAFQFSAVLIVICHRASEFSDRVRRCRSNPSRYLSGHSSPSLRWLPWHGFRPPALSSGSSPYHCWWARFWCTSFWWPCWSKALLAASRAY